MIIILKDADFSANNIGQVTIPVEYDELTKKIFNKCTRFELGSEQCDVVDTFIKAIRSAGIVEHLGAMFLPWLSVSNEEAFYNFADDTTANYTTYGTFETKSDGRCNPLSDDGVVAVLQNSIPTINFFGLIRQAYPSVSWAGNPYFRGRGIMVSAVAQTGSMISCDNSFNAGHGYKTQDSDLESLLIEIDTLSNLEQSAGTKINGQSVLITEGYNKSEEPLSNELLWYAPNYFRFAEGQARTIALAGDGTSLTTEQSSALLNAMKTLKEGLAELELD